MEPVALLRAAVLGEFGSPLLAVHVARGADGSVEGFLATMEHGIGFEPLIEYLCVREDLRGQGLGTELVRHFEQQLFPRAANLYLFVSDINPAAMRLYTRLGYLPVGALPDFNLESQTEFLYRKTRRPLQAGQSPGVSE